MNKKTAYTIGFTAMVAAITVAILNRHPKTKAALNGNGQ